MAPHMHCENGVCRMVEDDADFPIQELIDFLYSIPAEIYPIRKRTYLLEALDFAQQHYGRVSFPAQTKIAAILHLPLHEVTAVVRFYKSRFSGPAHIIELCCGDRCFEHNAGALSQRIQGITGPFRTDSEIVPAGSDAPIYIQLRDCIGACSQAPAVRIDGRVLSNPDEATLRQALGIIKSKY